MRGHPPARLQQQGQRYQAVGAHVVNRTGIADRQCQHYPGTVATMITWTQFEQQQPALAPVGRGQFYQHGLGLGFLATVRKDGGPRVHPVCPVISTAGLHVLILPGPKRADLRRDGRYSLHTETFPPPREDDGFAVSGRRPR